ncbi:MAG: hypothetical protein ACI4F4_04380 [Lachnospiraceae bacterium]
MFLIVIIVFLLWWVYAVMKRYFIHNNSELWASTEANIIDDNDDYQNGFNTSRNFRRSVVYSDYKIEYFVQGKRYVSHVNGSDLIGCDGTVEIEYLKKRPTYIRSKKGKRKCQM